jgi:hypothetical protein
VCKSQNASLVAALKAIRVPRIKHLLADAKAAGKEASQGTYA